MNRLALFALALLTNAAAHAQKAPPPNYETWGVCPFECCTYRDWTADGDMPVHKYRSEDSPVLFRLRKGEPVVGVDGVVVAEKAAAVTIDRPVRDGYVAGSNEPQLSLNPGDVIYLVAPLGEGAYRFWYEGKIYTSGDELAGMPGVDGRDAKLSWWKQVRNQAGKSGWTRSGKFQHVDACG